MELDDFYLSKKAEWEKRDGWEVYYESDCNPADPRPDLNTPIIDNIIGCRCNTDAPSVTIIYKKTSTGIQFKARCDNCYARSGAIPYSLEIKDFLFYFGKYKGKNFESIYKDDPQYFDWCLNNLEQPKLLGQIIIFLRTKQQTEKGKI